MIEDRSVNRDDRGRSSVMRERSRLETEKVLNNNAGLFRESSYDNVGIQTVTVYDRDRLSSTQLTTPIRLEDTKITNQER